MPKIIYDIIRPKYHRHAKHFMVSKVEPFWQQNSGKIKLGSVFVLTLSVFAMGIIFFMQAFPASADVINLRPDGDQTAQWPTLGTNDSSCAGGTHCDQVDDNITQPTSGDTANYVRTGTAGAGGEIEEYTMTTTTGVYEVTSVKFWMYSQTITLASTADTLSLTINIGGADQTAVAITPNQGSYTWQSATFNGSWSQADLDAMRLKFTRNMLGTGPASGRDDDIQVATVYAEVTYTPTGGTNTVAISTLGTQNSPITIPNPDQYFGGVFVIKRTSGSATSLTNVTVSNTGTTNAQFSLTNVKLIFDIDSIAPYDCASVSKDGDEIQFGLTLAGFDQTQRATFTVLSAPTISGTETFCGYLVADVVDKGTLDIKFDLRTGKRSSGATSIILQLDNDTRQMRTITIFSEGGITISE